MTTDTMMATRRTPTQRLWEWLGFRRSAFNMAVSEWRSADPGDEGWWAPGAIVVETAIRISWGDRVRILVSGWMLTETSIRTEHQIERMETKVETAIAPPGFK